MGFPSVSKANPVIFVWVFWLWLRPLSLFASLFFLLAKRKSGRGICVPSLLWCVFRVGSMICRDIMEPRSFMMLLIVYSLIPMSGPSLRAKSAATEEKKGHFCSVALLHLHSCQTVLQPLLPQISSFSWHLVAS